MKKYLSLSQNLGKTKMKLITEPEKVLSNSFDKIKTILSIIRQDPELISKIYDNARIDTIPHIFANFFMDNFFDDILNINEVEDELLCLIWRALNKEFQTITSLNDYQYFLRNTKCAHLLNGILNKYEVKLFFHNMIEDIINEIILLRNQEWDLDILSLKKGVQENNVDIYQTLIKKDKKKENNKDKDLFFKTYLYPLDKSALENYKENCDNDIIKEYCTKQLNENAPNKQFIQPLILLEELLQQENSDNILLLYSKNFMSVKKFLFYLIKKLQNNASLFPNIIRSVCTMIKIIMKKKFPDASILDIYHFVGKYFFSIFFKFLEFFNNEVYIDVISEKDIELKIQFIISFFNYISEGELYNKKETFNYNPFNWFLIKEFMPMYYDFFEELTNLKFSKYIEKLINDVSLENYIYDYFIEYPNKKFRLFSFYISIDEYFEIIQILVGIYKKNQKTFFTNIDNTEKNSIINYIENRQKFLPLIHDYAFNEGLEELIKFKDITNNKTYYLISEQLYLYEMQELKNEIESNPNCIFSTKETNLIKEKNFQSELIIKFQNLLSLLLFKDRYIKAINSENTDILNILNESVNCLKNEISTSKDYIGSFWYVEYLIPLVHKLKNNNIKLDDIYTEMDNKLNKSINSYDYINIICIDIINKSKDLNKIKQHLKILSSFAYEIQINNEIVPILYQEFKKEITIEYEIKCGLLEISRDMSLTNMNSLIHFVRNLKEFLEYFPKINTILLDENITEIIVYERALKVNQKFEILKKSLNEIIEKCWPLKNSYDNIIQELITKNFKGYNKNLGKVELFYKTFSNYQSINIEKNFKTIFKNINKINDELHTIITKFEEIKEFNKEILTYREKVNEKLNNFLFEKLYEKLFPTVQCEEDKKIYKKCVELSWIEINHIFENKKYIIHKDFFIDIIKYMKQVDIERVPLKKYNAINKLVNYVLNIICFNEGNENSTGKEEVTPFLFYAIIKAKPIQMFSNLEYMKLYEENNKSPYYHTIYGIVYQLMTGQYKFYNISKEEIKQKCAMALSKYSNI